MIPFHETAMGREFYERTMPKLARAVDRLATNVERRRAPSSRYTYAHCDAGWELRNARGGVFAVIADAAHEREAVAAIIIDALARTDAGGEPS